MKQLDELIEKIKKNLSQSLGGLPVIGQFFASDDDDEDTEVEEVDYDEDSTAKVKVSQKDLDEYNPDEDEDEESGAEDEEENKKKKLKQNIIRGVIIVCLVLYVVDEFILSDGSNESTNAPQVTEQKVDPAIEAARKKRQEQKEARLAAKKAEEEKAKAEAEAAEKAKAEAEAAEKAKAEAEAAEKAKAEAEAAEKAKAEAEAAEQAKVEAEAEAVTETETEPAQSEDPSEALDQIATEVEEEAKTEEQQPEEQELKPIVVQKADKYVAPPDYEMKGRGLVYNCQGKHWACVGRKAYFQCRKNERWQKQEGKPLECHLDKTYATDQDCETVQKYKVNTNASTDFCNN